MRLRRLAGRHPLAAAVAFQGMLVPLALALAGLLGVRPWADLRPSIEVVLLAFAAVVPLIALLAWLAATRPAWFRDIDALVRDLVDSIFRGRGPGAVLLVSALAGFGEELLFRGVVQGWLTAVTGPWPAVVIGALVFGLAHYLSRAYFVLALSMGVYLGALYQLSGNLWLPILVHALYDAFAIEYLLRGRTGLRRP